MNTKARKFLDQFIKEHSEGQGYSEELNELFSDYVTENFSGILVEDHEKKMTSSEMAKHIKKLYKMCEDEKTEKKFLKRLGKAAGVEDCSEKDIKKCAENLCKEDEDKCDDTIHELEGMVDYEYDPDSKDDDDDDDDEKSSKKKVDEAAKGSVIRAGKSKMVVLADLGGGDVRAAHIHHGKPLYRTSRLVNSGNYVDTGEKMKVNEPDDEENARKNSERDDGAPEYSAPSHA